VAEFSATKTVISAGLSLQNPKLDYQKLAKNFITENTSTNYYILL
jgi:hypothetical protein